MITGMPRIAIAVRDFQACIDTFGNKLGMPVIDLSATSVASLGANLAMCIPAVGSNIELMSPANPATPLAQSLQRFLDRRGDGLFALMLEAPDPNAEAEILADRGLDVLPLMAGASGRDIHPRSTHGVLIRVYPVDSFKRPAGGGRIADSDLSGIIRVIIAVHDVDQARTVYGTQLGMEVSRTSLDSDDGVRRAICQPPSGGQIELVGVVDSARPFASAIAEFLQNHGEGMYALVLQAANPSNLASTLINHGLAINAATDSPDIMEVDREHTFGARLRVEPR
jgi:catechol 2,3-dioxygenase-like lactoylglutathione lyase family enzyme